MTRRDLLKKAGVLVSAGPFAGNLLAGASPAEAPPAARRGRQGEVMVLNTEGLSYWEVLMFSCLQGLANRDAARVWFKRADRDKQVLLDWYKNYDHLTFTPLRNPYDLFAVFEALPFRGYAVVDPQAPATINIASNYASIERVLPVTEELLEGGELPDADVTYDLRGTFKGQAFREMSRAETYRWAYENQWPETNHARVALLSVPEGGAEDPETYVFYESNISRDYVIAEGGFFFDLSSARGDAQERALKSDILADMEARGLGIVFGWHTPRDSESQHVRHLSEYGQTTLGGSNDVANFSFHSRVDVGAAVARFRKRSGRRRQATTEAKQKVYLTFVLSDGDSINHLARNAHGGQWLFPERGTIPFGWEMQPMLTEVGPGILDYFQATATENDAFVASASGIGYVYPSAMTEETLTSYLETSKPYLRKTGLRELSVLNSYRAVSDEKRRLYREILGEELDGVIQGYTRAPGVEKLYWGRTGGAPDRREGDEGAQNDPMAWLSTALPIEHTDSPGKLRTVLETLALRRPQRPLFVPVHLPRSYFTYPEICELMRQLDSRTFEAVGPGRFSALFAQARSRSVVVNPPEFFVAGGETLSNGALNKVFVELQSLADEPLNVTLQARLTCEAWEEPLTSTERIDMRAQGETEIGLFLSLRNRTGRGEGRLEYRIDGEPHIAVPVRFE